MRGKEFATDRGRIRYWIGDSADTDTPCLVFLPGLTADHRLFDAQIAYFEEKARCFAWDPPAHGSSRPFALDFTMNDMAGMLHDILAIEHVESPVLVGQSMGGYVSQAYLELFPDAANGFVSIDSAPLKRKYYPDWEVTLLKHTEGMYRAIPWPILKPWGAVGASMTAQGRAQMRAFMDDYTKEEYVKLTAFGYRILADAIESSRRYDIPCPTLLLCGEKDRAGDTKAFNRKWSKGEGIELVWVPKAGHNANADNPEFVNGQIEAFLNSLKER